MKHALKTAQIADFLKKPCFKRNTNYKNYWFYVKICVSRGTLTTKITDFLKKAYPKRNTNCKNCWFFEKNNASRGTKVKNTEYFRKNNVSRGTDTKKRSLAHHFACRCKKIIIYGGYFCCFFLFHVKQPGFLALYCVFLVILSRQNTCLPVFLVVSCETPGIFFGIM